MSTEQKMTPEDFLEKLKTTPYHVTALYSDVGYCNQDAVVKADRYPSEKFMNLLEKEFANLVDDVHKEAFRKAGRLPGSKAAVEVLFDDNTTFFLCAYDSERAAVTSLHMREGYKHTL